MTGRGAGLAILLGLAVLSATAGAAQQTAERRTDPFCSATMRSDARLNGVCFVDAKHGWAMGDRGTIWHSDDGGRRWRLQHSGVSCPLKSVFFLDDQIGWAAGGFSHPYTHTSTGVLLATRDGGRTWRHIARRLLPALHKIGFFDARHGWAVGNASAIYPSGVFITSSGGRNWKPLPGTSTSGWLAGDFVDPHTAAVAGRRGAVAVVQRGAVEPPKMPPFGLRAVGGVKLLKPVWGWLVGDGGLVMLTGDLGVTWQVPPGDLPEAVARGFDFNAVAVRGPKCWIAGSPGTRVLHTEDAGQSWVASATGQNLPIHALAFVDDLHGWAVGAMGTILVTEDGGRTWQRQRAGGTRAAVLGLFSRPEDVPLELFARLSGDEGYLGVVEVLNRRDIETPPPAGRAAAADRLHEALLGVGAGGATIAWRFPLRQAGLRMTEPRVVEEWNRANDGQGLENLREHLVRQVRLWRPEIVVTHDASLRGDDPRGHLINQAVLEAVRLAADPTACSGQITGAGLEPWRVKKVYASLASGEHGSTDVPTAQVAARLGRSLAEVAAGPRGLIAERFDPGAEVLGFRLLVNTLPQEQGRKDFFSGIVLHPGGEARRELVESSPKSLATLRRIAQKRRNVRAILERLERDPRAGERLLAEIGELVDGLDGNTDGNHDGDNAATIIHHLAERYKQSGRWELAAETLGQLIDRYPNHPLTDGALVWLVQYYASGEAAWRVQGSQRKIVRETSAENPAGKTTSRLSIDLSLQEDRMERAADVAKWIQRARPELFAEPAVRFPLSVVDRRRGFPRQAERYWMAMRRRSEHDTWWTCARGESWLAEPNPQKGPSPKPVMSCVLARTKPRLDGRLGDAVWSRAKSVLLRSARHDDEAWPANVILAYDEEFLYIAIWCHRAPDVKYASTPGPRPRDPDLSAHDRVALLLDLDRDYATYYRLSIDHRGWTGEDCWGDRTWNPSWFVAADGDEQQWCVEAAIPLEQLTGRFPRSGDVWALGIQRTVPGVGFQSWTTPASTTVVPEGFGFLVFE